MTLKNQSPTEENENSQPSGQTVSPADRVISFIDGFNLYRGMRDSHLRDCYWLDVVKLSGLLSPAGTTLVEATYFTARISGRYDADKQRRQSTYLDALATLTSLRIVEGTYRTEPVRCSRCHFNWQVPREKQTDVSIATEMLLAATLDRCDTLLLISGDSDLVPPIRAIHLHFPRKRVIVGFPPNRYSHELKQVANGFFHVGPSHLRHSQLPDPVTTAGGFALRCPAKWA